MPYCMGCNNLILSGVKCPNCGSLINEENVTKGPLINPKENKELREKLIFSGKTIKEKEKEDREYQEKKLNE